MQEDKKVNKKGFLKGMKAELKKVIWPTGKQTVKSTAVTIAFVLLITVVLIVLNLCFDRLNNLWINSLPQNKTIIQVPVSGEAQNEDEVISGDVHLEHDHLEHNHLEHDHEHIDEVVSGD